MTIETPDLKRIIESALFASSEPLSLDKILSLFTEEEKPERQDIREALDLLREEYQERGIELVEVSSGFRFQVKQNFAPWVSRLWEERPPRYSRAILETLALIAYRQPITRAEIEDIRGVSVSTHIMKTLQERNWVKIVGHRDVPGKPAMYATTREFLDYFNLKSMDELPSLAEIRDLDSIKPELEEPQEAPESATAESQPADQAELFSEEESEPQHEGEQNTAPEATVSEEEIQQQIAHQQDSEQMTVQGSEDEIEGNDVETVDENLILDTGEDLAVSDNNLEPEQEDMDSETFAEADVLDVSANDETQEIESDLESDQNELVSEQDTDGTIIDATQDDPHDLHESHNPYDTGQSGASRDDDDNDDDTLLSKNSAFN